MARLSDKLLSPDFVGNQQKRHTAAFNFRTKNSASSFPMNNFSQSKEEAKAFLVR